MASQTWENLLNAGVPWQTTNGTQLTTSASTATISPQAAGPQDFILPTQYNGTQWYPGMGLKISARGVLGSAGTTSNLTIFLAVGVSGTLATTLCTTGALTLGTGSLSNIAWRLKAYLRVLAVGSSGNTLSTGGDVMVGAVGSNNAGTLSTALGTFMGMNENAIAFNTYTAATAIGLRATLSAAFGNITCNQFLVEQVD
jgi:hypothetical protein